MLWKIVKSDLARSKLISLTLTAFVCAAALLISVAASIIVKLSGSVDALMNTAIAPDFMQMHSGEVDRERMARFAEKEPLVKSFQIVSFLNIDGAEIRIGEGDLSGSVQDNGLCVQSESFDYLIGNDGSVLQPEDGELYLPVCYASNADIGTQVYVCGKGFTLAGFLRDSQMESSFASSKRFLVSQNDYEALRDKGTEEYLIEFLLNDRSVTGEFETAYASAGLEANGPAVTYSLFRLLNSLSGGILAGAIILLSVLIVGIAFLCTRFTLLTKLEEDAREIGVMRALGLARRDVEGIYLGKYALISAFGCLLGLLFSFSARGLLLSNMSLYMSDGGDELIAAALGLAGVILLFCAVSAYVHGVLKRSFRASASETLRRCGNSGGLKGISLAKLPVLGANVYLGLNDLLTRRKLYATFVIVLILASFIVVVPQNLYATVSSDSFIGYMGTGISDMRIDLQQAEDIAVKAEQIEARLASDPSIERYAAFSTGNYAMRMPDGETESIHIDLGEHELFPAQYSKGSAPKNMDEIALSALEAKEIGKAVGDTIVIIRDGKECPLTVCGIYSDITNGGKTAKSVFSPDTGNLMRYMFSVDISDGMENEKIDAYKEEFGFAKVSDVKMYVSQTLGGSINAMRTAAISSLVVALFVSVLITALFIKMLTVRDLRSIAVLRAVGFTAGDLRIQYLSRVAAVMLPAFTTGALLANTLGESLAGVLIASLGASDLRFAADPVRSYLICPALLAAGVLVSARSNLASIGETDIHNALEDE